MIIFYSPFPSLKSAEKVGETLIKERLARCVNILPANSIFEWKGKVERAKEYVLIAKTSDKKQKEVKKRIEALHPYELPAVLLFKVNANEKFAKWIDEY